MPASRAIRASSACSRAPSSPASAKPEDNTTTAFTPRAAQSRSASGAAAAGTARIAISGATGASRTVG